MVEKHLISLIKNAQPQLTVDILRNLINRNCQKQKSLNSPIISVLLLPPSRYFSSESGAQIKIITIQHNIQIFSLLECYESDYWDVRITYLKIVIWQKSIFLKPRLKSNEIPALSQSKLKKVPQKIVLFNLQITFNIYYNITFLIVNIQQL